MIYCVWYPSGGFGHFINAILSLHGDNFVRPGKKLEFSESGNSHDLDLVVPKFFHGRHVAPFKFNADKNYSVLIDNGINDESDVFKSVFPDSKSIKICYNDRTWPIVANTMIVKAMESSIKEQLPLDKGWNSSADWAHREKYFLFLRDHNLRSAWRATNDYNLELDQLLNYNQLKDAIQLFGITINSFEDMWVQWRQVNKKYIDPITTAGLVINAIKKKSTIDLSHVTDIWTQAVVYYYIWLEFGVEVPYNDYSNWFTNTNEIATMLHNLGVNIDSH